MLSQPPTLYCTHEILREVSLTRVVLGNHTTVYSIYPDFNRVLFLQFLEAAVRLVLFYNPYFRQEIATSLLWSITVANTGLCLAAARRRV